MLVGDLNKELANLWKFLASQGDIGPWTKPLARQWRLLQVLCADFSRVHFEI
jgi:hypothetical protein